MQLSLIALYSRSDLYFLIKKKKKEIDDVNFFHNKPLLFLAITNIYFAFRFSV